MRVLTVEARLECARAAVAVLRTIGPTGTKMRYGDFAVAVGLRAPGEPWEPWHRQQTRDILNLVAAVEHQCGEAAGHLRIDLIVNEQGQPGTGYAKATKLVTTDQISG